MAKGKEYQGHVNYNAWNVALYLFNDFTTYTMVLDVMAFSRNKEQAARRLLAQLPPKTPDGVPYTKTNIRLALQHWEGG